jgi:hypothetical protein
MEQDLESARGRIQCALDADSPPPLLTAAELLWIGARCAGALEALQALDDSSRPSLSEEERRDRVVALALAAGRAFDGTFRDEVVARLGAEPSTADGEPTLEADLALALGADPDAAAVGAMVFLRTFAAPLVADAAEAAELVRLGGLPLWRCEDLEVYAVFLAGRGQATAAARVRAAIAALPARGLLKLWTGNEPRPSS